MSARTIDRLIKVSRTIADLAGADRIERPHLKEAAGYRAFDPEPVQEAPTIEPPTLA